MPEIGGFHEVRFPEGLSFRSSFGPGFQTHIVQLPSGQEQRVVRFSTPRHRANAQKNTLSQADRYEVKEFFVARVGAAHGFRFKDWSDYTTAPDGTSAPDPDDQVIGAGDGSKTQFQLVKRYESGGNTTVRNLRKPVTGTTVVAIDGTPAASGWSVDTTTGIVTFSVAPLVGEVISAGCEFDIPMRFDRSADEWLEDALEGLEEGSLSPILLVEDLGDVTVAGDFFYGGGADLSFADDITITPLTGRTLRLNATTTGKALHLPDTTQYEIGGPYWFLYNAGANNILVKYSGSTLFTLNAGAFATICCFGLSGGKVWRGF